MYRGVIGRGKYMDIYVEFSIQPSIHIWELCLWWQNMTVYGDRHFLVEDPSGTVLFSAKELFYGNRLFKGYLISWRGKYYTERGIEPARFTIMINSVLENVTEKDIDFAKELTIQLIKESVDASYAKYSKKAGFTLDYYIYVVLPFNAIVLTLVYILYRYNMSFSSISRIFKVEK